MGVSVRISALKRRVGLSYKKQLLVTSKTLLFKSVSYDKELMNQAILTILYVFLHMYVVLGF